jgi:DNA-binding response OmpR family regulator
MSAAMAGCGRRPRRILVIDDDPAIGDLIAEALSDMGYAVRCASDGETGWRRAMADAPDLVLCDVRLPGLDGLALARRLRTAERQAPLVLMSSDTPAWEGLADGFLRKPFSLERLLATVGTLLHEATHTLAEERREGAGAC